ncbi:ABC transporter permease [Hominifimenecus microfluidus]|uniref:ABC transporter permease n=1 Tax=Hominifimenecus microfluidus TaxID=2885348 RepID=UPI0032BFE3E7
MSGLKYVLKRLLQSIIVLLGLSVLIFCIARVIPGDTATMALGSTASEEAKENYREQHHLNDPLPIQYMYWIRDAVQGNFGNSTQTKRAVSDDIADFLPATLELILFAAVLEIVCGIGLGVACARRSGGILDNTIRVTSYLGIATPSYVWAIFFMLIFCFWIPILPTIGRISSGMPKISTITGFYIIDGLLTGNPAVSWDAFKHLIMPGTALALTGIAQSARITRSSMLDNMSKDFVGAEISSGIPMKKVMWQYVLRPSATPSVSIIALDIAAMLGNAFVVEQVFSYPGISKYCLNAILNKDLNAIVGVVMVIGVAFLVVNILVDIISGFLDPRNRL